MAVPTVPSRFAQRAVPRKLHGASERRQHWDLLLISAAGLILVGVGRIHSFVPALDNFRPALVFSVLGMLALVLGQRGARSFKHLKSPLGATMLFIFGWAVLGAPFGLYQGNSARFLAENFLRVGVVLVIIAGSVRNLYDLERLVKVYALGAIAFSLLAQGTGGFRDVGGGGYDPNDSAMFLVSGVPLIIYFLARSRSIVLRLLFALGLLSCGSAIVLSGSRGGFLALVGVLGFSLFFSRGIKPAVRVAVVAAVAVIISISATGEFWERIESITAEDDYNRHSIEGRQEIWTRGAGYMLQNPVLGVGINNFSVAEGSHPDIVALIRQGQGVRYSAAHSVWVQAGAELGIPGFLGFLGLFAVSILFLWRAGRPSLGLGEREPDRPSVEAISRTLIALLIGVAIAGTFLSQAYSALFWSGFALVLAFVKITRLRRSHSGV